MQQYCETIPNGTPKYTPLNGAGLNFLNTEKSLIICADDFALSAPVSEAITQLAGAGRISATSVMSLSPYWRGHAEALRVHSSRVDVGLHLDLTSEFARTEGYGESLNQVLLKSFTTGYPDGLLDAVIESQLDKFEAVWGAPPDHIDGHQHIHQFPGIRSRLVRILLNRYADKKMRPWLRVSKVRPNDFKSNVISLTGAERLRALLEASSFNFSPVLLGVYGFNQTQIQYRAGFKQWLSVAAKLDLARLWETAKPHEVGANEEQEQQEGQSSKLKGSILLPPSVMCHPSTLALEGDPIGRARSAEFAYLSSKDFENDLAQSTLTLVRASSFIQKNK